MNSFQHVVSSWGTSVSMDLTKAEVSNQGVSLPILEHKLITVYYEFSGLSDTQLYF